MIDATEIVEKMNNQKINYDRVLHKMIQSWEKEKVRPRILIHSCCAPCSTYTLEFLTQHADVTIFFSNSNIHPESEYQRRVLVQEKFIHDFNTATGNQVDLIIDDYKPNEFIQLMQQKELIAEPEGGKRCTACFNMRLDLAAKEALERGFDYFGSALTISPKKNSQLINQIGMDIQKIYNTHYLTSDFKKNSGYQRSIEMCKEYDVYRQCYCGCVFAAKQQGCDLKIINKEAKAFVKEYQKQPTEA
ncbi:DNA integration/recombination/inversion protein [Enterococcus avium]|uniref:Epoxyqueuosine reductase QueH n=1 Tax=Enterococcus avium TaxID=33945 RepID=A0A4P8KL21_ENTAV|nr:epoxyqueuosine reductase QueH [Enterococcus sp. K18_3]NVN76884.1 DNA integration/recombination/inversion protein [Enterococcus avium]OFL83970.1 DNA integration/recombination/inversion protein [Enterococcus sp. HMSC072H05]OFN69364.1 DNA integration/recombination/inversion protein [Enterococcus sp. HMSC064A12]OFT70513.1 DNA integration/recombination/inversion protein [Enterococcus sp. HMSC05C03]TXV43681.1 DNA integration/recombination/inversion protein [Enterococcus sp. T0101B.F-10]